MLAVFRPKIAWLGVTKTPFSQENFDGSSWNFVWIYQINAEYGTASFASISALLFKIIEKVSEGSFFTVHDVRFLISNGFHRFWSWHNLACLFRGMPTTQNLAYLFFYQFYALMQNFARISLKRFELFRFQWPDVIAFLVENW